MKIDITKEQYKNLILMSGVANSVFGVLGDSYPDTDYKTQSRAMDELEETLLGYANDFGCDEYVQDFEGKKVLDDKLYEKKIMPILDDYDASELETTLANKLAWRDFHNEHSESEIDAMAKKNGGYFGVEIYSYEEKYWNEFENYEFDRLVIKE